LFSLLCIGSFLDTIAEEQRVDARVEILLRLAQQNDIDFWADADRTRRIVRFQDRVAQVRYFLDFCTSTLAMVYNAAFPRNPQPATLPDLMKKFKNVHQIHDFVKAQLMAGARFALIWLKICHLKLDLNNVIDVCYSKLKQRRKNIDKLNDVVTPIAKKMVEGF
jgi:CII-binding regulator of phage lambda lysogenization HflD